MDFPYSRHVRRAATTNLAGLTAEAALVELQGDIDVLARTLCQGRLTTESGVANSASDRTSQATIYFTPYNGNLIGLHDGTRWNLHTFTERSLALSGLTSGKNYDVFLYNNSGTLTLELTAWTNDSTQATAPTLQDGVYVKSGATTRRYLGTIRTTGTTTTEDSKAKRFVWNYYNPIPRPLYKNCSGGTFNYNTAAFQIWNNDATNIIEWVTGMQRSVDIIASTGLKGGGAGTFQQANAGPANNNTTSTIVQLSAPVNTVMEGGCAYTHDELLGYNYVAALQRATGTATNQYYYFIFGAALAC